MPTSDYHAVSSIMGEIQRLSPASVLELGVGFGKFGVLCREILDARFGRCRRDQWQTLIHGWEIWREYDNPCWDVYDQVVRANFANAPFTEFDLVLMIDSLEHLSPDSGRSLLRDLVKHNRHVIVSVPNGRMDQGETYGNAAEAHLWTFNGVEEFAGYNFKLIHQSVCTVVSIKGCL
jgi:hypothetical protein